MTHLIIEPSVLGVSNLKTNTRQDEVFASGSITGINRIREYVFDTITIFSSAGIGSYSILCNLITRMNLACEENKIPHYFVDGKFQEIHVNVCNENSAEKEEHYKIRHNSFTNTFFKIQDKPGPT